MFTRKRLTNTIIDEDSNTICDEASNTTCEEDLFGAEKEDNPVHEDRGEGVDIIPSRQMMPVC